MLLASDIFISVLQAKCTSGCWAKILSDRSAHGDNIECDEKKFMLLIQWISIMEEYYCQNFDTNNSSITPDYACLTATEAELLLAKIKVLIKG
jgi:hypothetical protein